MANHVDVPLSWNEDANYRVGVAPPTPIGGWTIEFNMYARIGGEPIVTLYTASGYNGASGLSIANSGDGILDIPLYLRSYLSGRDFGNYPYYAKRTDSGYVTNLVEGYVIYTP